MWRASALVMHQRNRGWLAEYAASLHACQPTKTECLGRNSRSEVEQILLGLCWVTRTSARWLCVGTKLIS